MRLGRKKSRTNIHLLIEGIRDCENEGVVSGLRCLLAAKIDCRSLKARNRNQLSNVRRHVGSKNAKNSGKYRCWSSTVTLFFVCSAPSCRNEDSYCYAPRVFVTNFSESPVENRGRDLNCMGTFFIQVAPASIIPW